MLASVPQACASQGYTWVFVTGIAGGVLSLLLALTLKAGRSVLQGGSLG